ncbi:MAG: class III poly(R)-hydroxyalkanoic acid synthase subunit PhaC [Candidatus Binatia bacterium]|nr:MAG: class III poly(R)-hydroxyalkanoic acid synthase subunit PhaC [Candidatus Binatia bacterium]
MLREILDRADRRAGVEARRALLRFLNGLDWLLRDPQAVVGRTPHKVILQQGKLMVRQYHLGSVKPRFATPVVLIPPLMVKPFIYDLYPGRSLVEFLLESGFRPYVVDFGEPDEADQFVRLDQYVMEWLPAACRAVREDAGTPTLTLLGYCMGGVFCLMYVAAHDDRDVHNLVCIATPVDMSKMGLLAWVAKLAGRQVEVLARQMGNVPGGLSSTAFRLLTPMKNLTRYTDLFLNLWNHEYVLGFEAMNQWIKQFIDYPRDAFVQFTRDFMQQNKLARGQLTLGGRVVHLRDVKSSLLVFAGKTDQVAPPASVRALMDKVGSTDKTFILVPAGHMGILAGANAPSQVWQPMARWLEVRSQPATRSSRVQRQAAAPMASQSSRKRVPQRVSAGK